jgi:hypothetical protein
MRSEGVRKMANIKIVVIEGCDRYLFAVSNMQLSYFCISVFMLPLSREN